MELFCRNRGSCQWNYFLKTLLVTAWFGFWIEQMSGQKSEAKVIAAAVGETVTFNIPVTGNIIAFTWYRGRTVTTNQVIFTYLPGRKLATGPQYTAREMGLPDGSLQIKDVLKNYTGNYTRFLVEERKSAVIHTMQLRIYVRVSIPIVHVVTKSLTGNGSLVLFCNASGTDVSYQWFLNKKLAVGGGRIFLARNTLSLSPYSRSDTGTIFTCRAYNAVSNATSSPSPASVSSLATGMSGIEKCCAAYMLLMCYLFYILKH